MGAPVEDEGETRAGWHVSGWAGFAVALFLGAAVYAAWLAWDTEYYFDADMGAYQGPYRPAQVIGCAVTFGFVTAALALLWRPVLVAAGTSLGFWLLWTVQASRQDETGLFVVGSILLLAGLTAGSAVAASVGFALRKRWGRTAMSTRR